MCEVDVKPDPRAVRIKLVVLVALDPLKPRNDSELLENPLLDNVEGSDGGELYVAVVGDGLS